MYVMITYGIFYTKRNRDHIGTLKAVTFEDAWSTALYWARSNGYDPVYIELVEF